MKLSTVSAVPQFVSDDLSLFMSSESGVKLPRSCLLQHVSLDFAHEEWGHDFVDKLHGKGYRGDASSVWAIEVSNRSFGLEICL